MSSKRPGPNSKKKAAAKGDALATELRIIAGKFRGRKLLYHGDPVTRPMKHRVREAMFNLISTASEGRHAVDLFAGTGALGLESLSRGAVSATFIEKHIPTARIVEENIASLGVQDQSTLLMTSAFLFGKRNLAQGELPSELPWIVFCSPPYAFYVDRQAEMLELIGSLIEHAPPRSVFLVESDQRFDFSLLPGGVAEHRKDPGWDVRTYSPAVVGVWEKGVDDEPVA